MDVIAAGVGGAGTTTAARSRRVSGSRMILAARSRRESSVGMTRAARSRVVLVPIGPRALVSGASQACALLPGSGADAQGTSESRALCGCLYLHSPSG